MNQFEHRLPLLWGDADLPIIELLHQLRKKATPPPSEGVRNNSKSPVAKALWGERPPGRREFFERGLRDVVFLSEDGIHVFRKPILKKSSTMPNTVEEWKGLGISEWQFYEWKQVENGVRNCLKW